MEAWYRMECHSLGLVGRVRVADDGVNVTLGGPRSRLEAHIRDVSAHPLLLHAAPAIDFKLAASAGPASAAVASESSFEALHVRRTRELVTLGPRAASLPGAAPAASAARHLAPSEFHNELLLAAAALSADPLSPEPQARGAQSADPQSADSQSAGAPGRSPSALPPVLVDVRNVYETRIGRFRAPGVETLDPATRSFSSFPAWADAALPRLAGRKVLMYCTGGVRCERASAYILARLSSAASASAGGAAGEAASDGAGDGGPGGSAEDCGGGCTEGVGAPRTEVLQLAGGIQRYLEAFPDGGFFTGRNFVFDERGAVPPPAAPPDRGGGAAAAEAREAAPGAALGPASGEAAGAGGERGGLLAAVEGQSVGAGGEKALGARARRRGRARCAPPPLAPMGAQLNTLAEGSSSAAGAAPPAVAAAATSVGRCQGCGVPCWDYLQRSRCVRCRLLLLHCAGCAAFETLCEICAAPMADTAGGAAAAAAGGVVSARRRGHRRRGAAAQAAAAAAPAIAPAAAQRRLRILCLHGFLQTGGGMANRFRALQRKLADVAEFVFIDAPHPLPAARLPPADAAVRPDSDASDDGLESASTFLLWTPSPLQSAVLPSAKAAAKAGEGSAGAAAASGVKVERRGTREEGKTVNINTVFGKTVQAPLFESVAPKPGWQPRRAWLVEPADLAWGAWWRASQVEVPTAPAASAEPAGLTAAEAGRSPQMLDLRTPDEIWRRQHEQRDLIQKENQAVEAATPLAAAAAEAAGQAGRAERGKYSAQTEGWDASTAVVLRALREQGPFDGLLGFSQGAAFAAAIAETLFAATPGADDSAATRPEATADSVSGLGAPLRFVWLCSGYPLRRPRQGLSAEPGAAPATPQQPQQTPLRVPSLHVFGVGEAGDPDSQVRSADSVALMRRFDAATAAAVRHDAGHIVPANAACVERYRVFLNKFLTPMPTPAAAGPAT